MHNSQKNKNKQFTPIQHLRHHQVLRQWTRHLGKGWEDRVVPAFSVLLALRNSVETETQAKKMDLKQTSE